MGGGSTPDKKAQKQARPKARLVKGMRDLTGPTLRARWRLIERVRVVYERFGFLPLETPAIEFVDALGKFLPEANQPDAGIFGWQDEDDAWIALRYDLTAPLARYVAQAGQDLVRPFRRYAAGSVWRVEKPGPGRFREFMQIDADIVGASGMLADAEIVQVMTESLEAIGLSRGAYVVRINNRKVLSGVLATLGIDAGSAVAAQVLRTLDKYDKVGLEGVRQLLTTGRKDESGDFTPGCGLSADQASQIEAYFACRRESRTETLAALQTAVGEDPTGQQGIEELTEIERYLSAMKLGEDQVVFDPTIVRGLAYYTGPVFEASLTRETVDETGTRKEFGTVMSGGRYDDLVQRFTGQAVPATGCSMGVDRMIAALAFVGALKQDPALSAPPADVLVTVMDKSRRAEYLEIAQELRADGLRVDLYQGNKAIGQQVKYADRLGIPVAVIAGSAEFEAGIVQVKDLELGRALSSEIEDRETWRKDQPAQQDVSRPTLVATVRSVLARSRNDGEETKGRSEAGGSGG